MPLKKSYRKKTIFKFVKGAKTLGLLISEKWLKKPNEKKRI
jgi:hypothetical protein